MTTDEKTVVIHRVILDALEPLPRKHKYPPRGVTAPVYRTVEGHPATATQQCSGRGQGRETPQSVYKVVCSPRGFPLFTKNSRSNLHQHRRRWRHKNKRGKNHHHDSLKI